MPHFAGESAHWGPLRILLRKCESRIEEATLTVATVTDFSGHAHGNSKCAAHLLHIVVAQKKLLNYAFTRGEDNV